MMDSPSSPVSPQLFLLHPSRNTLSRISPHRMSIQHTYPIHLSPKISCVPRSKSLPNIINLLQSSSRKIITSSSSTAHCCASVNVSQPDKKVASYHQKPKILKKTWDKVKTIIHNPPLGSSVRRESLKKDKVSSNIARNSGVASAPSTPLQKSAFDFEEPSCGESGQNEEDEYDERERIRRNYALLQKRLSEELHQRMSECSKATDTGSSNRLPEHLSDEFKKRLQQWEMWRASTGKVHYTEEELQQIVPQEFSKKMLEWECIKHSHHTQVEQQQQESSGVTTGTTVSETVGQSKKSRKKKASSASSSSDANAASTAHLKELAWLEKQLEKIEVEKKRLEREMKKYLEREKRLEKMKEVLKNSPTTDVWIKTPTAKCKVEKITEKFAKKLYEWEEKQGIEAESSTMALLNPKYYDTSTSSRCEDNVEEEHKVELLEESSGEKGGDEGDCVGEEEEEEVLGPLDLINARLKEREGEEETEVEKSVRRAMDDVAEALAEADGEGRISSAASSCCCSADYDEPTDSFATQEKNNSGASNTDSEMFYKPEPRVRSTRRRSSDAISTPLSDARSPSLSAFTSDDEGEGGLLKTVSEENDDTLLNVVKDAESQTEVIVRAKPVVVEEDDDRGGENQEDSTTQNPGIFVQTKRTIFTPILDDDLVIDSTEHVVLIQQDSERVSDNIVVSEHSVCGSSSGSIPSISSPPVWKKLEVHENNIVCADNDNRPKVVGAIPKNARPTDLKLNLRESEIFGSPNYKPQPKTQLHRAFPKMGKIPVWCSPLVARRQFSNTSTGEQQQQQQHSPIQIPIISTPDDSDFSIDKFLQDSKLLDAAINTPSDATTTPFSTSSNTNVSSSPFQLQPPKRSVGPRLPKTNPLIPRKYTIGGGFPPSQCSSGRGTLLTRSNSFGYQRGMEYGGENKVCRGESIGCSPGGVCQQQASGSEISLDGMSVRDDDGDDRGEFLRHQGVVGSERIMIVGGACGGGNGSRGSMHSVTKSKSTGSIRSKFGRALARGFGFKNSKKQEEGRGDEGQVGGVGEEGGGLRSPLTPPEQVNPNELDRSVGNRSRRPSGTQQDGHLSTIRRLGSWIPKVGGGGKQE